MRPITALTLAPALLVSLTLGACSSSDDDASPDELTADAGQTSTLNPDLQPEGPTSSTPGGDTTAVAGLWNSTRVVTVTDDGASMTGEDVAYVNITDNGLWTSYDDNQDIAGNPEDGLCYRSAGPFTLTPEGGTDYSLAGEEDVWTLSVSGDVLSAQLGDGEVMNWPRTQGEVSVEDFNECTVAPGPADEPDPR